MSIEKIKMPGLGESVTEATITMWLVKPGDKINKYDPVAEVMSDKVSSEIPSNFSGTVVEQLVAMDETVPIDTEILSIEVEGTAPSTSNEEKSAPESVVVAETVRQVAPQNSATTARFSPVVMRLAQEKGIDLAQVVGTGNNGRITKKDVMNFVPTATVVAAPTAQTVVSPTPTPNKSERVVSPSGRDEIVPVDGVRKAIAKHIVQSVNEIPHAWVMVEADVSNLVKLRNSIKEQFKKDEGISLSYFPFFIKAVVQALKTNPKLNTSWLDGSIIYHKDINISIAVAAEDHLYVPVIKHADELSVSGIAKEVKRLADGVQAGTLTGTEMQSGTFTVNNTGTFGSVQSMGIINHPQAAILQVESITKRIVPTADVGFKAADMVNLCLSIDHRILDGLQAGRFLKDVKENLTKFTDLTDLF
ncbi:MAG: 2-oxo acid dehydrogenase subunit E2 [Lactobacillales bacterium]|jgi:2-oxoisovalerate dehydrogenase E2 component (dihydrolipoyl transacylase)|nr:2-oxo acid dehydrogenase subunit E2 [Lactobacillales bacterium]